MIKNGALAWHDCTPEQARGVLRRNDIDAKLFTEARRRLILDEMWHYGPTVFLFDTLTNKAARVTVEGPEEFNIKVSSRSAEELFDDVAGAGVRDHGYALEHVVIGL